MTESLVTELIGLYEIFKSKYGLPVDGIAGNTTKKKLVDVSDYNEQFVKNNINKGNKFTHYGGKSLESQVSKGTGKKKEIQLPAKFSRSRPKIDVQCRLW